MRLSLDFSVETLQARGSGMRKSKGQPRAFYQAKLTCGIKGEIKSLPDKEKLKELITTRPGSEETLKGVF